jgi:hypothetical protein
LTNGWLATTIFAKSSANEEGEVDTIRLKNLFDLRNIVKREERGCQLQIVRNEDNGNR